MECSIIIQSLKCAGMMELADVTDSKSVGATRAGSSPATGTKKIGKFRKGLAVFLFYMEMFGFRQQN